MKRSFFILALLCLFSNTNMLNGASAALADERAANSTKVYLNKNGSITPGKAAIFNFRSTTDQVLVHVIKRGGQAIGWVEVYVDNVFKERLEFSAGSRNLAKDAALIGVKNKSIRIKVINKAGEEAFKYELRSVGNDLDKKIRPGKGCPRGYTSGTVQAGQPKVMTIRPLCDQIEIVIQRTGGRAAAEAIIYLDNIWTSKLEFPKGVNTTQRKKYNPLNGRTIRVEIINKGAQGDTFQYKMQSIQSN